MTKCASKTLTSFESFDQVVDLGKFQKVCKKFIDCRPNWLINFLGPNAYRVPHMIGPSVQSNKRQAPSFSIKSRDKRGAMGEDLQHVSLCDLCSSMNGLTLLQQHQCQHCSQFFAKFTLNVLEHSLFFSGGRDDQSRWLLLILTSVNFIGHC